MAPPETRPPFPPRYEAIAALGKGGGGEVWRVRDRHGGRELAMKVLADDADERELSALVREAAALSGLEGLGVPRIVRFGRMGKRPYLVREIVEGESLADRIKNGASSRASLVALAHAADQLTLLHRALLLHGDIKPANVIVGPDGKGTLVDLGLAATYREGGARAQGLTPRFAAPELLSGAPITARAEVYALGATIRDVFEAGKDELAPEAASLEALIRRATAEEPGARYPSVDEVGSALRLAISIPPTSQRGVISAWPIVGLDQPASDFIASIVSLPRGGGIVLVGPSLSGRSTLLRRAAWSLGAAGLQVVFVEAREPDATGTLTVELAAHGQRDPEVIAESAASLVVLIDDAEVLPPAALERLDALREAGAKLVLVAAGEGAADLPGRTFRVFSMPPLADRVAIDLVRRAIPSLPEGVAIHVVSRSRGWPGRVRAIVAKLEGRPVVGASDVDRLAPPGSEGGSVAPPSRAVALPGDIGAIRAALDRGHFDEAAELLERHVDETSLPFAIARSRLLTNRGESARALAELGPFEMDIEGLRGVDAAEWHLHAARAHLRGGDYASAESHAEESFHRIDLPQEDTAPPRDRFERAIAAEAMAIGGLARSYASRHDEARDILERGVRHARAVGESRILSVTLGALAFALQREDRLDDASAAYAEGLGAAEQAGDAGTVATMRLNLAGIAKNRGDLASAIEHLEAAVDMGRRSGRIATLRQALLNLANLDIYLGRLERAQQSLVELTVERALLPPHQAAQLLSLEAESAAKSGDLPRAGDLCLRAAEAYEIIGRSIDAAEARLERVLFIAQLPGASAQVLQAEIDRAEAAVSTTGAHRPLFGLARGRVALLAGDDVAARSALDAALRAAEESGQREWAWRALEVRAAVELDAGRQLAARNDREAALGVLEEIAARLPRDLREVYWNDPRRRAMRAEITLAAPVNAASRAPPGTARSGADRIFRVLEINREISGTYDLPSLLEKVTDLAIALLDAERGFVILKSRREAKGMPADEEASPLLEASGDLSIHASRDRDPDSAELHTRFSRSIADRVIRTGEPVVTASARDDARMADFVSVHQLMLQSVACVPIRSPGAGVIGALYLETRLRPSASFGDDLTLLLALSDQIAIAIETARLVSENEKRAIELASKNDELAQANTELASAREKLEETLDHRTQQLQATRRDLKSARAVLRGHFGYEGLVGTSEAMRRVYALVDRIKDTDVPVLIAGESGTGKEIIARAIHSAGDRAKKTFVGINCGAIPENLLESELFGHVRGAFTGAERDRKGLFREASEGTLLLDEIGEMPHKMQAGLLRVLQEKVVRPVGGLREEPIDTRVIAATHRDLATMVRAGSFREDLFYRLNVIQLRVPALRERSEDIPILIDHFLGIFAARYTRERRSVSRAALRMLAGQAWPGNVRQLENVLLNAWVLSDGPELEVDDFEMPEAHVAPALQPLAGATPAAGLAAALAAGWNVAGSIDEHRASEKDRILQALGAANWNRVRAAELVGLPRRTFYRRLKEYGIQ